MNNQENSESSNQQPVIEDLAVKDEAEDLKGGPFVGGWGSSMYQYGFSGTYQP